MLCEVGVELLPFGTAIALCIDAVAKLGQRALCGRYSGAMRASIGRSVNDRREGSHQWKPKSKRSARIYHAFAMFRPVKDTAAKHVRMQEQRTSRSRASATIWRVRLPCSCEPPCAPDARQCERSARPSAPGVLPKLKGVEEVQEHEHFRRCRTTLRRTLKERAVVHCPECRKLLTASERGAEQFTRVAISIHLAVKLFPIRRVPQRHRRVRLWQSALFANLHANHDDILSQTGSERACGIDAGSATAVNKRPWFV